MSTGRSRLGEWAGNFGLVVASLVAGLLILELGCRLWRGPQALLDWSNLAAGRTFVPSTGNSANDSLVGAVPRPGLRSSKVNIGDDGTRLMPTLAADAAGGPPLLAVGDSYTFGLDVDDNGTWPAFLQGLIRRRTINGGVPGFGLDQSVLRAEQLAHHAHPSIIVLSFIADDIRRLEHRRLWGAEKPFFSLNDDGTLVLHNVPVPAARPGEARKTLSVWQRLFGWSILIETILRRVAENDSWFADQERIMPPGGGEQLVCPLMRRLAGVGIPILVVAQYEHTLWEPGRGEKRAEHRRLSALVLGCASAAGLASFDTYDVIDKAVRDHGFAMIYLGEHHTALGNRLVAEAIAAELDRRGFLRR